MRFTLLVIVAMLCAIVPAWSDPGTALAVGNFLLFSVNTSIVTLTVVGYAAIAGAAIGFSALTKPKQAGSFNPGSAKQNFNQSEGPEIRVVGRARVGGQYLFRNTTGLDTYRVIALCRGPIDAIEEYFVGGREAVIDQDDTGLSSSPPWATGTENFLTIRSKLGDGAENVWFTLLEKFPALWTADHTAKGVAQLFVRFKSPGLADPRYAQLYGDAQVREQIETVIRGELIYDPRDAAQNINDNLKWKWTDNGILCAAHILRQFPSISDYQIDWEFIKEQANEADALVATRTGTEPRARAWGVYPASGTPVSDIMQDMLDSIGARIVDRYNGPTASLLIGIQLIDDNPSSELKIPAKHILQSGLKFGPEAVERPNVCRPKYYSPERNYDLAEVALVRDDGVSAIGWSRYESEIKAYGERPFEPELVFCPSAAQAQRVARLAFEIRRAETGSIVTNFAGLAAWGKRIVTIEFDDLDGAGRNQKCILTPTRINDAEGEVELAFLVAPQLDAWNPSTHEALPPEAIPELQFESELDQPEPPAGVGIVTYGVGLNEVRMFYEGVEGATSSEANFRRYDENGLPLPWTGMDEEGLIFAGALFADDFTGEKMDFRVRMVNDEGKVSYFSKIVTVESLAVNNDQPDAPTVVVTDDAGPSDPTTLTFDITMPPQIQVVRLIANIEGTITNTDAYPTEPRQISVPYPELDGTYDYEFRVSTSDGTTSLPFTHQITIS